jgi:hypothetical protein
MVEATVEKISYEAIGRFIRERQRKAPEEPLDNQVMIDLTCIVTTDIVKQHTKMTDIAFLNSTVPA